MKRDPALPEAESISSPSTFVPGSDRPLSASRMPVLLGLFVNWVVRDGKGWVRRL
ncbi:hypothetical protein [Brevundimonas sp.]|uniref:hypothetical protein n=1 Tax=Brevundimonas sp. TaxID=1871086 RepID=UPI003AF850A1